MTQDKLTVRGYSPNDAPHIIKLFRAGISSNLLAFVLKKSPGENEEGLPAVALKYLDSCVNGDLSNLQSVYVDRGGQFWVVSLHPGVDGADEIIVGMVGVENKGEGVAELRRMSVHKDHRKYGIGKLLLKTLEDYCKANNFKRIFLSTLDVFVPAVKMYEAAGYNQYNAEPFEIGPEFNNANVVYLEKYI